MIFKRPNELSSPRTRQDNRQLCLFGLERGTYLTPHTGMEIKASVIHTFIQFSFFPHTAYVHFESCFYPGNCRVCKIIGQVVLWQVGFITVLSVDFIYHRLRELRLRTYDCLSNFRELWLQRLRLAVKLRLRFVLIYGYKHIVQPSICLCLLHIPYCLEHITGSSTKYLEFDHSVVKSVVEIYLFVIPSTTN